jgi:hypothetical protein
LTKLKNTGSKTDRKTEGLAQARSSVFLLQIRRQERGKGDMEAEDYKTARYRRGKGGTDGRRAEECKMQKGKQGERKRYSIKGAYQNLGFAEGGKRSGVVLVLSDDHAVFQIRIQEERGKAIH